MNQVFLYMFFVAFSILLFSVPGFSQEKKDRGEKKTSIDFEDQLVEGEVKKPELFYLLQKKEFNYQRLIKLRTNFIPEMTKSAEDIAIQVESNSLENFD